MNRVRAVLVGLGAVVMAYAVWGALRDPDVDPAGVVIFLTAVLAGHDAVWLPAVLLTGLVVSRVVPPRLRPVARVALVVVAALTVVAVPLVLSYGRTAGNPSALPLPYGRHLILLISGVLAAAVLTGLVAGRKKTESRDQDGAREADR